MEFLDKKHRTVLVAIAKEGYEGVTVDHLILSLSSFLSKDSIIKIIEDLYFSQYITVLRDSNEVRYIASKAVRNAMISLELQRFRLTRFLENLKSLGSSHERKNEEILKIVDKGLRIISTGYLQLLTETPELTIPEYSELMEMLTKEIFSKLVQLTEKETSSEEVEKLLELIKKYRGEKDAETIRNLLSLSSKTQAQQ
ncbi:hypothetical protein [Metallosphaera hakonensis]|uniref:Uncharacterized protein n=1 Tax=Metallosphaera hakonensis JCM 8857 = DSM 7519 TaxID=1293036 RepID=A0A2U9IVK0_9CREN|nr:hypothetical protein [Metallosphaera hakonensis]AWS00101.1 hypothetical protein DFR87_10875 [Metallosphaera hakonensis JCM 8857 = DSM 7519]